MFYGEHEVIDSRALTGTLSDVLQVIKREATSLVGRRFGARLDQILRYRNVNKTSLAKALRVGNSTVTEWVKGLYLPDFENLDKLVTFLTVDISDLFAPVSAPIPARPDDPPGPVASPLPKTPAAPNAPQAGSLSIVAVADELERFGARLPLLVGALHRNASIGGRKPHAGEVPTRAEKQTRKRAGHQRSARRDREGHR